MEHDDYLPHSPPYEEGKTLTLSVTEGVPPTKHTIKVQVLRHIRPDAFSCVMEVNVLAVSGSTKLAKLAKHSILKLYDWRYATQLREDHGIDQWDSFHEDQYRIFVEDGGATTFLSALEDDDSIKDQLWDTARNETFLFNYCRYLHSCEVAAYRRLEDLQGKKVPRFFADVRLIDFPTQTPFFEIQGILLELVTGYSLADLAEHAPQSSWQRICDEAIRTVNLISDHGILNQDVKPRNILIRTHSTISEFEVIAIDFAQCKFREIGQSEVAWRHEQWRQDEEGAIGYVMAHKLKGAFKYWPSYRFLCTCTKCSDVS